MLECFLKWMSESVIGTIFGAFSSNVYANAKSTMKKGRVSGSLLFCINY